VVLALCWSSLFNDFPEGQETKCMYSILAVALKDGHIALWTVNCPAAEERCVLHFYIAFKSHVIHSNLNVSLFAFSAFAFSVWRCWLGGRKGIRPVKKLSGGVLAWLYWSEVQTCIWPSWYHCHSLSLASLKYRLVLPFWYRLTWVVLEKGNVCVCVCVCVCHFVLCDIKLDH